MIEFGIAVIRSSCGAKMENNKYIQICEVCGKEFHNNYTLNRVTCSRICSDNNKNTKQKRVDSIRETKIEKYGDPTYVNDEQGRKTKLKRYGNEYYNNLEKQHDTNLKKYGNKVLYKTETFIEKSKETKLKKYGDVNYNNSEQSRKKNIINFYNRLINSDRLKDMVIPMFSESEYDNTFKLYKFRCKKCNIIFEDTLLYGKIPRCLSCFPILSGTSYMEKEILEYIESIYNGKIIQHDRTILNNKYELDFYFPELKFAIEFDGIYYHSEINGNKDKTYHLNKTNVCEENGIRLIHIFEYEWVNKKDIIKDIIYRYINGLNMNVIYARKSNIQLVSNSNEEIKFLDDNHLQGYTRSKVSIGLYYNNILISILCMGISRYNKTYEWEILRYCNTKNTIIIGGFAKLMSLFIKIYTPNSIITYSDRRYFNGDVYIKNGFGFIGNTSPNYFYTKFNGYIHNRQNFQKHKLKEKLKSFNSDLTEWENMQLDRYDRIWDCGNKKFVWKNERN